MYGFVNQVWILLASNLSFQSTMCRTVEPHKAQDFDTGVHCLNFNKRDTHAALCHYLLFQ